MFSQHTLSSGIKLLSSSTHCEQLQGMLQQHRRMLIKITLLPTSHCLSSTLHKRQRPDSINNLQIDYSKLLEVFSAYIRYRRGYYSSCTRLAEQLNPFQLSFAQSIGNLTSCCLKFQLKLPNIIIIFY